MRNTSVKLKNKNGEDVVYENVEVVKLKSSTDEDAIFSYGEMATGEIELDFSLGNQEVDSPETKLYNHVTIYQPSNFIPENIALGVNIAGIIGSFEGAGDKPQLNKLTISRNGDTVTITNPSTNGNFVAKYRIYVNGEKAKEQTTTTFSIVSFGLHGLVQVYATALANGFLESLASSVITATTYSITHTLDFITSSNQASLITQNLTYESVFSATDNKFIPEDIQVFMGGEPCSYSWNSYSGILEVENVVGDIEVFITADDAFQIRRPKISWDGDILQITPERYAKRTVVYLDGKEIHSITYDFEYIVEAVEGVKYTFIENKNGYYESNNKGVQTSYAICKVTFSSISSKEIIMECINFAEVNFDYGIISKLNQKLSSSINDDGATGSTLVLKNFKGESSATPKEVSFTIPAGESFIYIKFRKDGSVNNSNDSLQFRIIEG